MSCAGTSNTTKQMKGSKKKVACCAAAAAAAAAAIPVVLLLGMGALPTAASIGSAGSSSASRPAHNIIEDLARSNSTSSSYYNSNAREHPRRGGAVVEPPEDWKPLIQASQMLFSGTVQFTQGLQLWPNIGNGYVGGVLGCFPTDIGSSGQPAEPEFVNQHNAMNVEFFQTRQNLGNDDPVATAGVVHVGGVFNGEGVASTRAEVPGVHSVYPIASSLSTSGASQEQELGDSPSISFAGAAIDFARATFFNRTMLHGCGDTILEQRWYAHQENRSLLVYEMEIISVPSDVVLANHSVAATCTVQLESCNVEVTPSMTTTISVGRDFTTSNSTIVTPETASAPIATVARVFRPVPAQVQFSLPQKRFQNKVLAPETLHQFLAVLRTNLAQEGAAEAADPLATAVRDYNIFTSNKTSNSIANSHQEAWSRLWDSRIEVGDAGGGAVAKAVSAAVNSSMYYLLSAARQDWPFATSPGGIANQAYQGHTFWDLETWQFPALAPFYPDLSASLLEYRQRLLSAAKARASSKGYAGALFPWESGVTGSNVCPSMFCAEYEQHITGDVAMAFRLQYFLSQDTQWLHNNAWPVLQAAAEFWASRVELEPTSGNYTVKGVVGPDESAGKVDDEAYTNALVSSTLGFALDAAAVLNESVGANWSSIAARPYLPLRTDLLGQDRPIHSQDKQYKKGQMITQSDVGLLQYPLEIPGIPLSIKQDDLLYYEAVTNPDGYYTGDSSYSIAWLALGNRSAADAQFKRTFLYLNGLPDGSVLAPHFNPFNVWKEAALTGKHLNFLTGAGGFLQNMLQGYGGFRARANYLEMNPAVPPNTTDVALVRLAYAGERFSLRYNESTMTVAAEELVNHTKLLLTEASTGATRTLTQGTQLSMPRGAFSLQLVR